METDPQIALDRLIELHTIVFTQWKMTTSQLVECQANCRILEIENENLRAVTKLDLLREKQREINELQAQLKADEIAIKALRNRLIEAGLIAE